ncbi:hypothetical protein Plhal304r1_c060g0146251 [Plasmopara halstedii]
MLRTDIVACRACKAIAPFTVSPHLRASHLFVTHVAEHFAPSKYFLCTYAILGICEAQCDARYIKFIATGASPVFIKLPDTERLLSFLLLQYASKIAFTITYFVQHWQMI